VYGLEPGQRCNAPLSKGVDFDHYPIRAADGGPGTLENCLAICLTCHRHKTRTFDIPNAAKGKRVSDRHTGVVSHRKSSSGRGFLTNRSGPFKVKLNGEIVRR
jgi:5-methylcytosine-specific restriction protein A